jgi:hypothetical protein
VRSALAIIVADEARHAELAWSTLRWALAQGGEPVRERLERVFSEKELQVPNLDDHPERAQPSHGLLSREVLGGALQNALDQVVRPAARTLLATG